MFNLASLVLTKTAQAATSNQGTGFKLVQKVENLLGGVGNDALKILSLIVGVVAVYYVGRILIDLFKEVKAGNWGKVAIEAAKALIIGVIAFFGIYGFFAMGRTVEKENLGDYRTNSPTKVQDIVKPNQ